MKTRKPAGSEPGPINIAMQDALAECPTEDSRMSLTKAAIIIWAGELKRQVGATDAADALRAIAKALERDE